ncbi:MAG: ABC transporter substrate-binding protein [Actinomycetaceae bacterium]|nr:ABC transporter substrate-binding protein [Actinomycetaceae bacterium]
MAIIRKRLMALAGIGAMVATVGLGGCSSDQENATEPAGETSQPQSAITITDIVDHTVEFDKVPERIILGESRAAYTLAFLNKDDPLKGVVAWGKDLQKNAPDFYDKFLEKFPEAKDIPTIGSLKKGDVTVENLLEFDPDVVVLTQDMYDVAQSKGIIDKLDSSDIKWVVTDYRRQPVENTEATVEILGKLTGNEDSAKKFIDYYKEKTEDVKAKVADAGADKPKTFLWRAAGLIACCATFKDSNFGTMIDMAGGINLGDELLPGDVEDGDLTPEQILSSQPDHVVVTGGAWGDKELAEGAQTSFVELGYATDHDRAEQSLRDELKQPGFSELEAGKKNQMYGIYHQFYDSPYNFIAIRAFAKWQYPDKFADVDLEKEFTDFHNEFMPFDYSGTFFVQLSDK